jgi:hypothetical protein
MKGHEYPRQLLAGMLQSAVPERLARIRSAATTDADVPETWPPDPKSYLLADQLPMKEELYPAVVITSTTASVDSNLQAGLGEFIYEYALTVGVAVVAPRHGGEARSSVGRDRIMLAVREALLLNANLADDCFAVVRNLREETGAAVETLQSQPMSLGNVLFTVRVVEELTDPLLTDTGDDVTVLTTQVDVDPVDAASPLP